MESGGSLHLILILLGAAALTVALLRARRRPSASRPPGTFDDPALDPPRRDLERLLADIQDLSREHIARLDTKIRLLDQLIQEADRKQRELSALLARTGGAPAPHPEQPPPSRPANPLHDQVYALHDAGRELLDICSATGLEKGEVELILGLRKMDPPEPSA